MMKSIRTLVRQDREKYVIPPTCPGRDPHSENLGGRDLPHWWAVRKNLPLHGHQLSGGLGAGQRKDVPGLLCPYQQSGLRSYHKKSPSSTIR